MKINEDASINRTCLTVLNILFYITTSVITNQDTFFCPKGVRVVYTSALLPQILFAYYIAEDCNVMWNVCIAKMK